VQRMVLIVMPMWNIPCCWSERLSNHYYSRIRALVRCSI